MGEPFYRYTYMYTHTMMIVLGGDLSSEESREGEANSERRCEGGIVLMEHLPMYSLFLPCMYRRPTTTKKRTQRKGMTLLQMYSGLLLHFSPSISLKHFFFLFFPFLRLSVRVHVCVNIGVDKANAAPITATIAMATATGSSLLKTEEASIEKGG